MCGRQLGTLGCHFDRPLYLLRFSSGLLHGLLAYRIQRMQEYVGTNFF
jgi:hypothetical protein